MLLHVPICKVDEGTQMLAKRLVVQPPSGRPVSLSGALQQVNRTAIAYQPPDVLLGVAAGTQRAGQLCPYLLVS